MNKISFKGNTFKIMQITDLHQIPEKQIDAERLISAALDDIKPDLVIFTGDQIKGYGISYLFGEKKEKFIKSIQYILNPLVERNVKFAFTFGNHDTECGVGEKEQEQEYEKYKQCYIPNKQDYYSPGNFSIPVYNKDNVSFNIYIIDSNRSQGGGYEAVKKEQIEWYENKRETLKDEKNNYIPSFLFQHIPLPEIYNCFITSNKNDKEAIRAFRSHKNKYYKLNDETLKRGGAFKEPPSIPDTNTGFFNALSEKGDIVSIFHGHDHKNSFVGTYKGIDIGYCPSTGFNEYGDGFNRGVRVFEIKKDNPRDYKTYCKSFSDYFGNSLTHPIKTKLMDKMPESFDAAMVKIKKFALGLFSLIIAILIIFIIIKFTT